MSQLEQKELAKKLRKERKFLEALEIYQKLWEENKDAWTGYFVALCLRQSDQLEACRAFHEEYKPLFPTMQPMKIELLWLDYKQYIKDYNNYDYITDAERIISQTNQYDKETNRVFIKTVLEVARRLSNRAEDKLKWLNKLNHSILDVNVFRINDIAYPADRKRYFIEYASALIDLGRHNKYVADKMAILGFTGTKHNDFFAKIAEGYTFKDFNRSYISILKLALVIKNLSEEIHLREKKDFEIIYNKNKTLSASDLSHYKFCEASYAIHRTYKVYSSETWQRDEWKKEKLYLADRYKKFHESKSFEYSFEDTAITLDQEFKVKFQAIFVSKLELNNATSKEVRIMSSSSKKMNAAPDYIFLHPNGSRFVVTEKFSHYNSSDYSTPFESDLIKHYAILQEFKNYNISFGLFLTWYYSYAQVPGGEEGEKKIVISHYRLTKVKLDFERIKTLNDTITKINNFSLSSTLSVDGKSMSHPKKCLNCSVAIYCHHKTGQHNIIELPYKILPLEFTPIDATKDDFEDEDLPF